MALTVLSADAARGPVASLAREIGAEVAVGFGAPGEIRGKFLAGEPCDLLVLTHAQVAELLGQGRLAADCCSDLGAARAAIVERGVALAPPRHGTQAPATVFTAAPGARSSDPDGARDFIARLTGAACAASRAAAGFGGVAIRRATGADTAAARALVHGVLSEYGFTPEPGGVDADLEDLDAAYFARGGSFDAAIDAGGRLVACCGMKPMDDGRVELRKMYALKEARGQGLGRRLLDRALAFARARGFRRVELETASVLADAIAFYRKSGFLPRPGKLDTCRCDQAYYLDL